MRRRQKRQNEQQLCKAKIASEMLPFQRANQEDLEMEEWWSDEDYIYDKDYLEALEDPAYGDKDEKLTRYEVTCIEERLRSGEELSFSKRGQRMFINTIDSLITEETARSGFPYFLECNIVWWHVIRD